MKYGERNCEKGIPIYSLIDSAIRHLSCYMRWYERRTPFKGGHVKHCFCHVDAKKKPEMQDIPSRLEGGERYEERNLIFNGADVKT